MIVGAGRLGQRRDQLAADDQRLLVGQRQVDALAQRGDGRAQAGAADDGVQDQVAVGVDDQLDQPVGALQHVAVGPGLGGARGGGLVGQRDAARRRTCAPARRRVSKSVSAARPTTSRSSERSTTSSACSPIEPVEPRMITRRMRPPSLGRRSEGGLSAGVEHAPGYAVDRGAQAAEVGGPAHVQLLHRHVVAALRIEVGALP